MNPTRLFPTAARPSLGPVILLAASLVAAPLARAQSNYATPYTFNTFAGTPAFPLGADGTGPAAQFLTPAGMCTDSNGNIYIADENDCTIRKVTPAGVVTTIAGKAGYIGSTDATGSAARFYGPVGITIDGSGNLYVADAGNNTIRMVTQAGVVTTVAGTAGAGGSIDGTGAAAQFATPVAVVWDGGSGALYVADYGNMAIRKVTVPGYVVTTFAGEMPVQGSIDGTGTSARFHNPAGIASDGTNLYVADSYNDTIRKIVISSAVVTTIAGKAQSQGNADGQGAAASFYDPFAVAVDSGGNIYVADAGNDLIRKVTSGGAVSTLAGKVKFGGFVDGNGTAAEFNTPDGVAADSNGNIYVSDGGNSTIRKIASSGAVTTLAGTPGAGYADGTGAAARFYVPTGIARDANGNMYIADSNNDTIRKMTPSGVVTTLAGTPGSVGSADGTGSAAQFYQPFGLATDGTNLYVADRLNSTIRKIVISTGAVTTIAGTAMSPGGTNGTGSAASFNYPACLALDGNGNLYVSEQRNDTIRKIVLSTGAVTTLAGSVGGVGSNDGTGSAAQFSAPTGMVYDGSGNLYVADYGNGTIRKVAVSNGATTTVAGKAGYNGSADGTVASARFGNPAGIAIDGNGNLFVADAGNYMIREISGGNVTSLAGSPYTPPKSGTTPPQNLYADGTGSQALFNQPVSLVVDPSGNLFVADAGNDAIRMGSLSGAPFIETQPADQYAAAGGSATFTVTASGSAPLSYQWNFNGTPISGATGSSYTVTNAQAANAGQYTVTVTNAHGNATSTAATLYVSSGSSGARLINISTRGLVGTGGSILIPGFVIGGSGTETLLIRADGPSLNSLFGVPGVLAAPTLTVINQTTQATVASNTGWGTNTSPTPAQIANIAAQVGAFPLPSGSADSAVVVTLNPGAYTVQVAGVSSGTGVALAEVYEVTYTGTCRLINISTRAQVGTGSAVLIPGFVISGSGNEQLLVRGDGPSLSTLFGVAGALAQPSVTVFNGQTAIATNTGWGTASNPSQIASVAAFVGAYPLPSGSADSALVINLSPGPYTMQVSGVGGTTGVALAEVYEVP